MLDIYTTITESTCGEACWAAREDICRCSCNGRNHGVIRGGERPERTRKLQGYMYQLIAVASPDEIYIRNERALADLERRIVKAAVDQGRWSWHDFNSTPGYPAKVKRASQGEVDRWPELAAFRDGVHWCALTVWVRCDMVDLVA